MLTVVYTPIAHEKEVERLLGEPVEPAAVGFVTVVLHRVVGVLLVDIDCNHIDVLFVDPAYRMMGIAAKLLQCARSRFPAVTAHIEDDVVCRLFKQNGFNVRRKNHTWLCQAR